MVGLLPSCDCIYESLLTFDFKEWQALHDNYCIPFKKYWINLNGSYDFDLSKAFTVVLHLAPRVYNSCAYLFCDESKGLDQS